MKICTKCKSEKPKTEFSKDSSRKDGLQGNCKACKADHYAANRERICARNSEWHALNKERVSSHKAEYRALNKSRIKDYYIANKQRILARQLDYSAKNKYRIAERMSAYYAENPDKFSEYRSNRRSRKLNAEGKHTAADVRKIFDHQRGLCANCQSKLIKAGNGKFHVDHIVPLSKGGTNWPSNLQCLCPECNLRKSSKMPEVWAKEHGRLI